MAYRLELADRSDMSRPASRSTSTGTSEMAARSTPEVRRDQRRLSAVPAERLDDGDAFMGCCARPQVVNRLETRDTAVENPMQ